MTLDIDDKGRPPQLDRAAVEAARRRYERELLDLINKAYIHGIILHIEQHPMKPLAMGHYWLEGKATLASRIYRNLP